MSPLASKVVDRFRQAGRAIPIDKGSIRSIQRAISSELGDRINRRRDPSQPLGEIDYIALDAKLYNIKRGEMSVRVLVDSEVRPTESSIIDASFGGKDTIKITLNGRLPATHFMTSRDFQIELFNTILHEATHAAESGILGQPKYEYGRGQTLDMRRYVNDPHEVRARMQEIVHQVLRVYDREYPRLSGSEGQKIQKLMEGTPTWLEVGKYFTSDSARKILQAVVRAIEEYRAEDKTASCDRNQQMDPVTLRVAARFYQSSVKALDLDWVESLRKDFLTLTKNLPRVKDYKTAIRLSEAFNIYRSNFDELFFEQFLNRDLKYNSAVSDDIAKGFDQRLRAPAWQFYIELSLPIRRADDYWSEEACFANFEKEAPKWKARIQRKAQVFWKEMKDAIQDYEHFTKKPGGFDVKVPDVDRVQMEGFQLIMRSYDSNDEHNRRELEIFKEGLKDYRQRASSVMPILLQKQLPLIIEFQATLDKGGTYNPGGTITFYASSALSKGPKWVTHALAHEMGHHLFKTYLSGGAREFWTAAIKGDYGDLNVQELLDKWPGDIWAFQFPETLGEKDPILALQVDAISHDPSYVGSRGDLQKKEDFQRLLDQGIKTLRVPQTPITGYASKNPEEAFCEAIGLLVSYGPRAVHEKIRGWLEVVLPGQTKLANERPYSQSASGGHYTELCSKCGTVISQCRCMSPHKEIRYGLCPECAK